VSETAFVALPAARAVERAALEAERAAPAAEPPDEPPDLPPDLPPPDLLAPPEARRRDDVPPEPLLPPGLIISAAVGLTPSTVFAADSIAVLVRLEVRSATSLATSVT
jgi:hypothetical protein